MAFGYLTGCAHQDQLHDPHDDQRIEIRLLNFSNPQGKVISGCLQQARAFKQ